MYFHIILRSAACKTAHISYFIVPHSVDYCKKFHLFFKESTKYSKRGSPFRLPQDSQKSQISGIMYADAQWASLQSGCSAYISVGTTIGRPHNSGLESIIWTYVTKIICRIDKAERIALIRVCDMI